MLEMDRRKERRIHGLKPRYEEAMLPIVLQYLKEELTITEISKILNIPVQNVRSRMASVLFCAVYRGHLEIRKIRGREKRKEKSLETN
jgi:hypothetical protein